MAKVDVPDDLLAALTAEARARFRADETFSACIGIPCTRSGPDPTHSARRSQGDLRIPCLIGTS
jgi:hypothetical protein